MLRGSFLAPSFVKSCHRFSLVHIIPPLFPFGPSCRRASLPLPLYLSQSSDQSSPLTMIVRIASLSTSAAIPGTQLNPRLSKRRKKRQRRESAERVLAHKLGACSERRDLIEALRLYDEARFNGVHLSYHHYNVLLYLCSSGLDLGLQRGFEIFQQMCIDKTEPNEATFTNAARLAAKLENPEMAFELVKQMKIAGIQPRLRSYGPALFGFCDRGFAEKAYEVDAHMAECGLSVEEPELSAILKVSVLARNSEKVYETLHRLRALVRQVSVATAAIIEDWFRSEEAAAGGESHWDAEKVKEGATRRGGGWHGQGWLGNGKWRVRRTEMDETGVCQSCGEKLVCIDIDPVETEEFAISLASLACQREVKADFNQFQEWLQLHGPFDAIVDGANVGLINHNYFSFFQLNSIVNTLRQMSPSKKFPLVILHISRVKGGPSQKPSNMKLLETWKKSSALYATPLGSNDDWYWLYAAVCCKSLVVTNDEMRDHLFQLLGTSFFPRWKEKHQVKVSASKQGLKFLMPPPYSVVIQESEQGSWHVPIVTGDDLEAPRQWICATRTTDVAANSKLSRLFGT